MSTVKGTIGFVGGGMMARALVTGLLRAGACSAEQVRVSEPDAAHRDHLASIVGAERVYWANGRLADEADTIVLAVKPQAAPAALGDLKGRVGPQKLLISIVTGLTLNHLSLALGSERVVRVMPNTPLLVGAGASAWAAGRGVTDADRTLAAGLLEAAGMAVEVPESQLDAITGLSGSGPAFICLVIEAMSDAGVYLGLPRALAGKLAAQTVLGAARMVLETGDHPGLLKDGVTTPGGTTIEGILELERGGLRGTIMNAVVAAGEKARRLSSK